MSKKKPKIIKTSRGIHLEDYGDSFTFVYKELNTYFSEHDMGESYLKPIKESRHYYFKKIGDHWLVYSSSRIKGFGLMQSTNIIAILDEPLENPHDACLEIVLEDIEGKRERVSI